ncbi:MAG: DUF5684 domain-containing protein [Patescibacteria group bacterium]|nr:DUF5684 domain-containing protein [Patescibacteria group bacterium]
MSRNYYLNAAVDSNFNPQMGEQIGGPGTGVIFAILGGVFLFMLIVSLVFYIYLAISLMKIAKKSNTPNAWLAWIPILNVILMLQIAKKPLWWILLFLIPIVNIIFSVLVWIEIAKAVGKPEWWGILIIIPFVGIIVPGYLAFSGSDQNTSPPEQNSNQGGQIKQQVEGKSVNEVNNIKDADSDQQ